MNHLFQVRYVYSQLTKHSYDECCSLTLKFIGCRSSIDGGAIHLQRDSILNVTSCIFLQNQGSCGAGIHVVSSTLNAIEVKFNLGRASASGGGICATSGTINIEHGEFLENVVTYGSGGGIYLKKGRFKGDFLKFVENEASNSGGGVYAGDLMSMSLSEVHFRRNNGIDGGAIGISNTTLNISRFCIFTGNNANTNGGSIYQELSQSSISSCHFENNAAQYGGSLWIGDSSMSNISSCTFIDNAASSYGGGMQIYTNTTVFIANSSFTGKHIA